MGKYFALASNIIKSRLFRDFGYPNQLPWKLLIEITRRCNSRCINCLIWEEKEFSKELVLADFERLFKANPELVWLSLTGGEPFSRPDIAEIVKIAKKHCRKLGFVSIPTNGLLPDVVASRAKEIMKTGVETHITVSLDGFKEVHDKVRGIPGNFERAVETLHKLRGIGIAARFQATVHKENFDTFKEFYEEFKDDIGVLTFTQISDIFYANNNVKPMTGGAVSELFKHIATNYKVRKKQDLLEKMHILIASKYLQKKRMMLPCTASFSSAFIGATGEVYPCFNMPSWGNVKTKPFKDIWFSNKANEEREKIKKEQCPVCWINCFSFNDMMTYPEKALHKAFF